MKPHEVLLHEQGFTLDAGLHHEELIPFVKTYLFKKNRITISFLILNILFVCSWLSVFIWSVCYANLSLGQAFAGFGYGVAISFLLAPLHELLHGAAYRISGAQKISYKANWKKLYFMAVADMFITGRRAFYFIGMTPFAVISLGLILLSVFATPAQQIMWLSTLWVHASMCSGDIGLMSYFAENKNREVITFDDAENAISYFYSRK
jgi:Putative zincin peptidase